jgi:hypothetical protein
MALFLKWQENEIALYKELPGEEPAEDIRLCRIELDFELSPLTLTSDEDRQRLLAAMVQLRGDSGIKELTVELLIPASWGVTHQMPSSSLSEEDLREQVRWELSKALIDSEDQYRYNFAYDADGGIVISALRIRLLESIEEVVLESGFQLAGIFLDRDPWLRVNLAGAPREAIEIPAPKPVLEEAASPVSNKPKPAPEPVVRRSQPSWFFAAILILGLIVVGIFAWIKLTGEKKPARPPEPVTQVQETAPAGADTVSVPAGQVRPTPSPAAPARGVWADMSRRVEMIHQVLAILDAESSFDLISFTEDRFLYQLGSPEPEQLDEAVRQVTGFSGLEDVKYSMVPPWDEWSLGVVSGKLIPEPGRPTAKTAVRADFIALGKNRGLQNRALVFTGQRQAVLSFLNDVASKNYGVYRLILVPWGDDLYRTVLEL